MTCRGHSPKMDFHAAGQARDAFIRAAAAMTEPWSGRNLALAIYYGGLGLMRAMSVASESDVETAQDIVRARTEAPP